jgi:predicted Zn-dependent protease
MRRTRMTLSLLVVILVCFLGSCAVIEKGADVLGATGTISAKDKDAITKTSKVIRKTFADITEEEEYYIGRAVAALILSKYPVYNNTAVTQYINCVGSSVVFNSDRPETYGGYHFLILDTEEVNALAAPGGFIFITKGLLKRCQDEEMLACILAHEVGHVSAKHGLKSIKKSRLIDAFKIIGEEAVQRYGPEKLAQLTGIFEDVLGDIAEKLIERGYDRKYEYEADELGVRIAASTGYNPEGLKEFLQTMVDDTSSVSSKGWFKTHPSAGDRINKVNKEIAAIKSVPLTESVRTKRFRVSMEALKSS